MRLFVYRVLFFLVFKVFGCDLMFIIILIYEERGVEEFVVFVGIKVSVDMFLGEGGERGSELAVGMVRIFACEAFFLVFGRILSFKRRKMIYRV